MCTETGTFSTHSFRTLLKNTITRDSKINFKDTGRTKKYGKNYNELRQELKS